MGMFAEYLSTSKLIDTTPEVTAKDRIVLREIQAYIDQGDIESPGPSFSARNAVQTLAASGATAGTFDINVGANVRGSLILVSVKWIDFNASVLTIQGAIDSSCAGIIPAYQYGDIVVSSAGTPDSSSVVLTYSGDSVKHRVQTLSTVDGTNLTGGGSEAITETIDGQTSRAEWAILKELGLIDFGGTVHAQYGPLPNVSKGEGSPSQIPLSGITLSIIIGDIVTKDHINGLDITLGKLITP